MKGFCVSKGFTITELLVSLFIFSLVIIGAGGLLVSGMSVQRRSGSQQELIDQAFYIAEYMSRALRQAQKAADASCLSQSGRNYEVSSDGENWFIDTSGTWIRFINRNNNLCQQFLLPPAGTQIFEQTSSDSTAANFGAQVALTSNNLQVTVLGFYISGAGQDDNIQPRATFTMELKGTAQQVGSQPAVNIQTTVSQRKIDVPE